MIRRIAKTNDLKDLIKSCPSGVIDDITEIRYFISGHPETEIVATFEKVGSHLEAILPTSELSTLGNGVLMRRALYKVSDPAYPDGYYNLEFVDNLDVWLGEEDVTPTPPGPDDYLTPNDLKTINNQSIVGQGNITIEASIPDYYATKSWVSEQGYLTSSALTGYATESWVSSQQFATQSWVSSQGYYKPDSSETVLYTIQPTDIDPIVPTGLIIGNYLEGDRVEGVEIGAGGLTVMCHHYQESQWSQDYAYQVLTESNLSWYLDGYATESWVQAQGYITSTGVSGLATMSWVEAQGYITSETLPEDIATQSWVSSNFLSVTALTGYATESWVEAQGYLTSHQDLSSYATKSWVEAQGYLTSVPSGYATESWVSSQQFITSTALTGYATESWVQNQGYLTSVPSSYATQSWVEAQGYLTSHQDLSSYATKSWVSSQQFATESWVSSQGYLTSHQNLSSYATKSWVSSNFVKETEIWTGTTSQWNALTSAQKSTYKIALITE